MLQAVARLAARVGRGAAAVRIKPDPKALCQLSRTVRARLDSIAVANRRDHPHGAEDARRRPRRRAI